MMNDEGLKYIPLCETFFFQKKKCFLSTEHFRVIHTSSFIADEDTAKFSSLLLGVGGGLIPSGSGANWSMYFLSLQILLFSINFT